MAKKNTDVMVPLTEDQLAVLNNSYPVEQSFNRILLPRLGFYSQDQTEGKGKSMKVTAEAGTFFTEMQSDEVDENGKKIWKKGEIGTEIEAIILYERKQLRFYDGEKYTSSPVYDSDEQTVPLFKDKVEVDRGTPKELKSRDIYQGKSAKGKPISKLEDNRVLYMLYNDKVYQLNIRGTSMYAFQTYKRTVQPNTVVTHISSEAKENGSIAWNQLVWKFLRPINGDEGSTVIGHLKEIKESIAAEIAFYASKTPSTPTKSEDDDF